MSDDIDIVEHDLLEHPTLRNVFPDLSIVKQEVVSEIEEHSYHEIDSEQEKHVQLSAEDLCYETAHEEDDGGSNVQYHQDAGETILKNLLVSGTVDGQREEPQPGGDTPIEEEEKPPPEDVPTPGETQLEENAELSPLEQLTEEMPAQDTQPLEGKRPVEEKPDSTTDLVVDITEISPSNSPLVTSSQSLLPSHEDSLNLECPLIGDKVDSDSNPDIPDTAEEVYKNADDYKVAESYSLAKGYKVSKAYSVAESENNFEHYKDAKGYKDAEGCDVGEGYKDDKVDKGYKIDNIYKLSEVYSVPGSKNNSEGYKDDQVTEGYKDDQVTEGYKDDEGNEADGGSTVVASDYEEKCFQSYVALEHWGPFLENSKCYCAECEILFATENAIAAHNMIDHSHLTEVSAASVYDRSYGRKQDNTKTCDVCSVKFSTTSNLTKHKKMFHGNNVQKSSLTTRNGVLQVGQIIMKKSQLLSKNAPEIASTANNTPRSNVQTLGKFKPKAKTITPIATPDSDIKTTTLNESSAQLIHHCQLCNTSLQTKEDLIAHLYSHVSHKCNFCNALFTQKALLEKHLWTHAASRHSSSSSMKEGRSSSSSTASVSPVKPARSSAIVPQAASPAVQSKLDNAANEETFVLRKNELLKCHMCSQCFIYKNIYIRHMANVHKKVVTSVPESARVAKGNTYCKPCRKQFHSVARYNLHTRACHVARICVRCNARVKGAGAYHKHKSECTVRITTKVARSKNVQKVGTKLVKPTNSDLKVQFFYKCTVCNASFGTYRRGYKHLRRHHPDSERHGVIVRDTQKLVLKKATPKVPPEKPFPGDDLIGFVIKKTVEKSFNSNKSQRANTSEVDNMTMLNTVIRCPGCDTCFKKYVNIKTHLAVCTVRPESYYRKCKICHMKFSNVPSTTDVHEYQHKNCDNLQVLDYDDYVNSLHKILYKCDKCEIYYTSLHSILAHFSSTDKSYKDCEKCGYRIASLKYTGHMKGHEEYNLSRKDYIVIRFSHFPPQMRAVKRKLSPVRSREEKPIKTSATANSANGYTLIQCENCKHHFPGTGIIKHKRLGIKCKNRKFAVCQYCGLTFSQRSLTPHMRLHKERGIHLTLHDFSIMSSNRKPIASNLKMAMNKLHICRCGLRAHKEMYLCPDNECKNSGIKCEVCDVAFVEKTYLWHLKFHKAQAKSAIETTEEERTDNEARQQRTDEKADSAKKPIVMTYVRCGKCKLHLRQVTQLSRHNKLDCSRIKRVVCLKCGLIFSEASIVVHEALHEQSPVPLTIDNFRILRLSDFKPVKKELCSFPSCSKCGLRAETANSAHGKFRLCEKDTSPKITCQTCRMTFATNVYHLHLPYYGCSEAEKVAKITRADEERTVKAVARIEEEIDDSQITKMMSKYNSMDQLWTELYQCDECKVLVDSYDEIMKHCEDHRSAAFEVSAFMCHVCDLNFDSPSFKRHKEQHFTRPGLNRTNFEVIVFRPSYYRTVWWQFYKNAFTADRVTYKLKQEGPEQHTIYQCINCKSFCSDKVAAYEHTVQERYCRSVSSTCCTCGISVHKKSVDSHEDYHAQYPSLTARGFRIFWFCKNVENNQSDVQKRPAAIDSRNPKLYKCAACHLHFLVKKIACRHYVLHLRGFASTAKMRRGADCSKCGLSFTSKSLFKHQSYHHKEAHRHFNIETISSGKMRVVGELKVHTLTNMQANKRRDEIVQRNIEVQTKGEVNKKPVTLYYCTACKLHYLVRSTLAKHIMHDHEKFKMSYRRVTCSYCNLSFSAKSFAKHRELHHVQNNYNAKDFRIVKLSPMVEPIEKTRCKLYKCSDCGTHCLNARSQRDHMRTCYKYISKYDLIKCKDCQLTFLRQSMRTHLRTNCKQCTFDIQEFTPLKLNPQSSAPDRKEHALYKCSICHVHYLTAKMMQTHMSQKNHNLTRVVECGLCRIAFRKNSFTKHVAYHHKQLKLKLEDFTVIDVKPNGSEKQKPMRQATETPVGIPKLKSKTPVGLPRRKSTAKSNSKNVLYKCVVCNIVLLKRKTASIHIMYRHKQMEQMDPKHIRMCDGCGLPFSQVSLFNHKLLHKNCKKRTFKIVEVRPGASIESCEKSAGIETTEESKDSSSEEVHNDANDIASNEQYENVEYLEENIDAESTATKNSNGNASSEESNSTSAEVKPYLPNGEEDQGSLMTVQLANKHICPKCDSAFPSDISKNLHMALDHMADG